MEPRGHASTHVVNIVLKGQSSVPQDLLKNLQKLYEKEHGWVIDMKKPVVIYTKNRCSFLIHSKNVIFLF